MRKAIAVLVWAVVLFSIPAGLFAAPITIKLGSLAPVGSPWDVNLRKLASEWAEISRGQVVLRVYPGGIAGDEADMIRKMRIGQLGGALITVSGLSKIYTGVITLSFPLLIESDDEFAYVLDRIKPFFHSQIEQRGYQVLTWTTGGWVYFFSRHPVVTPDDLKRQKLFAWDSTAEEMDAWRAAGFRVVSLPATEIMTGLQVGQIDALATSPLIAASNQWFGVASNMCNLNWAPIYGALIVSDSAWKRVPADLREPLRAAAERLGVAMTREAITLDAEAIGTMREYGLTVNAVPPAARRQWETVFSQGFEKLVGVVFDSQAYELLKGYIAEFRGAR